MIKRLTFRPIHTTDAPFLLQLMNTEKWLKYVGDKKVYSEADAKKYIDEKMDPNVWSRGFENYVMVLNETAQAVGTCSLHNREGIEGMDVGGALLPVFEGHGYAQEGVRAMIQKAFNEYNQVKVSAITHLENTRSGRALERTGFTFKEIIQLPHSTEDLKLYQLNRKI